MNEKVLVADDEVMIAEAISYALKREGYQVELAFDGEDTLSKATTFQPRVVILDVMMPKRNGFEVCQMLQSMFDMGVILLTAKNDIVDKVLGLEFGADDYVTKPFDIRELVARVKSLLRRLDKRRAAHTAEVRVGGLLIALQQRRVLVDSPEEPDWGWR